MNTVRKARIGLLGLMLELYDAWPDLKPAMADFAREIAATLDPFAEVAFPGVCNTREQVERAVAAFEAEGAELIVVVLLTYAPSHIALPALLRTRLPVLLYNTQQLHAVGPETLSIDTTRNHGMHGIQDLANVLLRTGRPINLVTGHYRDAATIARVKAWCDAARAVSHLRGLRIGLIGYPMEGMGDFGLDETAFLGQIGAEIRRIPMRALAATASAAPPDAVSALMAEDRAHFRFAEDITGDEHATSARMEWALRETLRERSMHGFASHFLAVSEEGRLETMPFLAASKLLADGYGFGGEGDATSAAAVCLMQALAGQANFTEMFTMDFAHNAALMMHMGEANWRMARRDEPMHVLRSTLGDIMEVHVAPLLLAFSLEPGDATLLSLTTVADGRLTFIVAEGKVLDFPYLADLARPHFKFSPGGDVSDFLTRYSQAGGSHHQALAFGHWGDTLEKMAHLLDIPCARL